MAKHGVDTVNAAHEAEVHSMLDNNKKDNQILSRLKSRGADKESIGNFIDSHQKAKLPTV